VEVDQFPARKVALPAGASQHLQNLQNLHFFSGFSGGRSSSNQYCYKGENSRCSSATWTMVGEGMCLNSTEVARRNTSDEAKCKKLCFANVDCAYFSYPTAGSNCTLFSTCVNTSRSENTTVTSKTYKRSPTTIESFSFSDSSYRGRDGCRSSSCYIHTRKNLQTGCVTEARGCADDLVQKPGLSCGTSKADGRLDIDVDCCHSHYYCNTGSMPQKMGWGVAFITIVLTVLN